MGRILALDPGKTRTGIAISDPLGTFATPLTTLPTEDGRLFATLQELVQSQGVERIVVGVPRSMSGRRGPQAYWAEGFRRRLAEAVPVPVEPWDERLTTVEADRVLRESRLADDPACYRRDAVAAALVLQAYLDHLRLRQART